MTGLGDKPEFLEVKVMINIRVMSITDYDGVYNLWINTPGIGLNSTDDSLSLIHI